MASRTASLVDALAHPGFEVLRALAFNGSMTEHDLMMAVDDASQATMNRRLHELERENVIERAPGARQQRGRAWRLTRPEETGVAVGRIQDLALACAQHKVAALQNEARPPADRQRDRALREIS